jgi:hypothetical protein
VTRTNRGAEGIGGRVKFLPLAWAGMPKTSFRKKKLRFQDFQRKNDVFGKVCPFKADHDFILCTLGNKGELSQNLPINATEPILALVRNAFIWEEIAAKVVDLETDTGVYAELYRAYAHPCLSKIFVPSVCMVLTMFLLLMLGSLGSF